MIFAGGRMAILRVSGTGWNQKASRRQGARVPVSAWDRTGCTV